MYTVYKTLHELATLSVLVGAIQEMVTSLPVGTVHSTNWRQRCPALQEFAMSVRFTNWRCQCLSLHSCTFHESRKRRCAPQIGDVGGPPRSHLFSRRRRIIKPSFIVIKVTNTLCDALSCMEQPYNVSRIPLYHSLHVLYTN